MDTIYDVIKIRNQWYVCKITPSSILERWIITSEGYNCRAEAFTEMHTQRWNDRDARQLRQSDCLIG
jgi:hypothetical protein